MKKTMSRILSLILILCMIPATVITAFARGKGVYNSVHENQSIQNATGQFIPERIVIDGKLNDTGWPTSGFASVDSNTGYWSVQNPKSANESLTYKYQIRADYEQLYIGASVVMPAGVTSATVYVYFKDATDTSADGYTDVFSFVIADGNVTVGEPIGANISKAGVDGCLPAEASQFAASVSGNEYTFEFRNCLADTFSQTSLDNVTYFVSVDLDGEALVHPKVGLADTATVPTFEYWPINPDGSHGGQFVATWLNDANANVVPSEINIDGELDEATWSSLTDFYNNGGELGDANNLIDFNDVRYNASASKGDNGDDQQLGDAPRYKYDVRIDGEYLYGAVVAYIPSFTAYTDTDKYYGTVNVIPSGDLYVYFYSNTDIEGNTKTASNAVNGFTAYPETVIQIRNNIEDSTIPKDSLDPQYVLAKYADIYVDDSHINAAKTEVTGIAWKNVIDDAGFEGSRAAKPGNIYTFEFKVKLDKIPTYDADGDGNQDIVYGLMLSDRLSISHNTGVGKEKVARGYAWTGGTADDTLYTYQYYHWESQHAYGNWFSYQDIQDAKGKVCANKGVYTDGNLAQEYWGALTAADDIIDAREKGSPDMQNLAYKLTADYEYLYGAALIKGKDPIFRIYLNRSDDKISVDASKCTIDGTWWHNKTETQVTSRNAATLFDGTRSSETKSPNKSEFVAWLDCHITNPTITIPLGSEKRVDRISAYFHGGEGYTDSSLWGIGKPADVKVYYSNDGVNYTSIDAELRKTLIITDENEHENPENKFHAYQYTAILSTAVNAQYIKIEIDAQGQFVWCSEIELYGTETFNQYYTIAVEAGTGDNQKGLRVYNAQKNATTQYNDITNKFVTKTLDNGYTLVEFRLSLLNIGITPSLSADENDALLYYYVAATNKKGDAALVHPKSANSSIDGTQKGWSIDSGAAVLTYGDMLGNVSVDGKLDEICWSGEDDKYDMIHVNAENGTWAEAPDKGNTLDFDYRVYAGSNYLYGAAIIDVEAISSEKAWSYEDIAHTRFNIWIDNLTDEYSWLHDDNPNTVMETDSNGKCYENYYYNIYLVDQNLNIPSPSGKQMCGGATPSWYTDASTGDIESIDTHNFKWAISTINGKTYVEFMIALDNFHCDREKGLNYYVSVTNAYGTETEDTSDDEILTLYHPALPRTQPMEMLVTLKNWTESTTYPAENAIVFDDNDLYKKAFSTLKYWEKVVFSPIKDENGNITNKYKVEYIHHSATASSYDAAGSSVTKPTLQDGWIAYAIHYDDGTETRNGDRLKILGDWLQTVKVGDEVVINDLDVSKLEVDTTKTGTLNGFVLPYAYHPNVRRNELITNDNLGTPAYSEAYRVQHSIMPYNSVVALDDAVYTANLPTATYWDEDTAGSIMQLTHFAPDVVYVDGNLDESVWGNENGWITVQDNINGSYQEATSIEEGTQYSYKLITDGEYVYVAMKLGAAYDAANSPSVRLWIKSNSSAKSYTHFYRITYSENGTELAISLPDASYPTTDDFAHAGLNGATMLDNGIKLNNYLAFATNTTPNELNGGEKYTTVSKYGDSAFFGYSEEVQENMTSGEYNPTINTTKYYHAKESAVMKSGANGGTYVEFKIALSEFGGQNGFEYFVQASFIKNGQMNTMFYPLVAIEADSDFSYYKQFFPMWDWAERTSVKVTKSDIESGEIRMRNNCVPVVTLGAKINANYVDSNGNECGQAIRMGALYTEDYLRRWRPTDATKLDPSNEIYTAPINDYWDVAEMGIVMLPTQLLGTDGKLTLETEYAVALSADNIVNWIGDKSEWGNFADYENFVFYVTLYGVPENVKISFCGFVDFYASTGTESFYDQPIVRSYNMVESITRDDTHIEE